jgi:hypothetical protein
MQPRRGDASWRAPGIEQVFILLKGCKASVTL